MKFIIIRIRFPSVVAKHFTQSTVTCFMCVKLSSWHKSTTDIGGIQQGIHL
jgi:hypothetical protein